LATTSSTVCALALKDKQALATNIKREKRQTEGKAIRWIARKSALMRSPKTYVHVTIHQTERIKTPIYHIDLLYLLLDAWFLPKRRRGKRGSTLNWPIELCGHT
jgi:hypothetical protein